LPDDDDDDNELLVVVALAAVVVVIAETDICVGELDAISGLDGSFSYAPRY
jgi:hypothetical protein